MKYGKLTFGQIEAVLNTVGGEVGVKRLLSGLSEVVLHDDVIDFEAPPQAGIGERVVEHRKSGACRWDPSAVRFYVTEKQKAKALDGGELRKMLKGLRHINVNMLDYLLEHPTEIPEDWKYDEAGVARYIVFWGTVYENENGMYVRALHWSDTSDSWDDHICFLDWRESDGEGGEPWEWACAALWA